MKLMTRFLRCTRIVTDGEGAEDDRQLGERDLRPWPASEDRAEGRGLWSTEADAGQLAVMAAIPQEEEEPPWLYRRWRVYDGDMSLIAEGDGLFHTDVDWSWTEPLGYANERWGAAFIQFFERGRWVAR